MQVCFSVMSRGGSELYITALLYCVVQFLPLPTTPQATCHARLSLLQSPQPSTDIFKDMTDQVQGAMELTTDLVANPRQASTTIGTTTAARRYPTTADWQRWKPTIAARYKTVPARVIIREIDAEHLFVT
jgi:hypothetical protein